MDWMLSRMAMESSTRRACMAWSDAMPCAGSSVCDVEVTEIQQSSSGYRKQHLTPRPYFADQCQCCATPWLLAWVARKGVDAEIFVTHRVHLARTRDREQVLELHLTWKMSTSYIQHWADLVDAICLIWRLKKPCQNGLHQMQLFHTSICIKGREDK